MPSDDLRPIDQRYLLLTFIPYYRDERGDVWLEPLWHRDFVEHLRYLPRLVLAAPALDKARGPSDLVRLEVPAGVELDFAPLPHMETTIRAAARLPRTAAALWRAIGRSDIVHSGVAGWPIPIGWVGNAIALIRRRSLVLIVESAPWRPSTGRETRRQHVRAVVTEALARFFVRRADVNLFTQPAYARSLAGGLGGSSHVTPATWIGADDILSADAARRAWRDKRGGPVRVLFAGRLVAEKGVGVLLDALARLEQRGVAAHVDVIGEGELRARCVEVGAGFRTVQLRVLDPVPYGGPFFELLRGYHAVLVPSLGDEQPRIVFDAFGQAVPVIAADTDGLRPHVKEDTTGWRFSRGDAGALADTIERIVGDVDELERRGMCALEEAPRFTHRGMHEDRWRILQRAFVE